MSATFHAAAERFLADQQARLPDLSEVTILVPNHHVAGPFLEAMRRLLGPAVFIPHRMATLPDLAAGMAGTPDTLPESRRLAELYALLSGVDWLDEAARWPVARDLLTLLRDMDDALLAPPSSGEDFIRQVRMAARRGLSAPLEMEARLLWSVWRALHGAAPGGGGDYALRLASWLESARVPLYVLGLHGLSPLERRFLQRCGERPGLRELPAPPRHGERLDWLRAALSADPEGAPLRVRAALPAAGGGPLTDAVGLYAARDLEDEARMVAARVRDWLREGRRGIAIVALDRLAARRLRAILERDAILIQDETGWTFSTASVSHMLDRWLCLLADGFYHRDLLDFLKSPYVFHDLENGMRQDALAAFEQAVRKAGVVEGLPRFLALASAEAPAALPLLARLRDAQRRFGENRRRSLSAWLETLADTLTGLGATPAIQADNAGRQLLDVLERLRLELRPDGRAYTLGQWRAWLNLQLDEATFREADIESPVRLTHLAAIRLRDFDALALLGADAARLPDCGSDALLGDVLRSQLGLPGRTARRDETREAFMDALCRADRVLITWQAWRGGDANPPSPWVELLDAFHRLTHGDGLYQGRAAAAGPVPAGCEGNAVMPGPVLGAVPERLSASGWQDLVSCPYRYFARHGLGLAEAEEVAEEMEKADYGELVHAVLKRFHAEHTVLAEHGRGQLEEALARIGREVFAVREAGHYLARAWRYRWERHAGAYLDWALAWEAQGHAWRDAERAYERDFDLPGGRPVRLRGRVDRIDLGPDGEAVLDYKTQARQALARKAADPGEHVQLPFYGILTGAAEAALVGLDDDRVAEYALARPLREAANAEADRLRTTLAAVAGGGALPAHGAPATCQWCELRGLCRKGHWRPAGAARRA